MVPLHRNFQVRHPLPEACGHEEVYPLRTIQTSSCCCTDHTLSHPPKQALQGHILRFQTSSCSHQDQVDQSVRRLSCSMLAAKHVFRQAVRACASYKPNSKPKIPVLCAPVPARCRVKVALRHTYITLPQVASLIARLRTRLKLGQEDMSVTF